MPWRDLDKAKASVDRWREGNRETARAAYRTWYYRDVEATREYFRNYRKLLKARAQKGKK